MSQVLREGRIQAVKKMKVCYRVTVTQDGETGTYGLSIEADGVKDETTYEQLAAAVDKQLLIDKVGLTGVVKPEQMEVITQEQFAAEFGDDEPR